MAKRDIRKVAASSDVAAIIDRGADVNTQIKNLGFEDKGLKTKITEAAQGQLIKDELSVRLEGNTAAAIVSGAEKLEIDVGAEEFTTVRVALDKGFLKDVIDRKLNLVVPPADVERAAQALKAAGITAMVTESLSVKAENLRNIGASCVEEQTAMQALDRCVKRDVSFRVSYEKL